jgi:hypothetical protein
MSNSSDISSKHQQQKQQEQRQQTVPVCRLANINFQVPMSST